MPLINLIYVSSAVSSLAREDILDILKRSRDANEKKGITGMLLFKDGNFMQVIEGDALSVDDLHQKISQDPRHTQLITLLREPIVERTFEDWTMAFKDISDLTPDEKIGRSDFLDLSFLDTSYVSNPSSALKLLMSFTKMMR